MGNGLIGKFLYFWVFIVGALFVLKITGFSGDNKTMAVVLGSIALIYIVWISAREKGKKRREEKAAANRPPVRKGHPAKKKKKR